jgi:hypothetical protein
MPTCLRLIVAMEMLSAGAAAFGNKAPPPPTQPKPPVTQPQTQPAPTSAGMVLGGVAISAALLAGGLYVARRGRGG